MILSTATPTELGMEVSSEDLASQKLTPLDPSPILDHINARFDFPDNLFDELVFVRANRSVVRAFPRTLRLFARPAFDRVGIDFLRIDMANPRLTTTAVMTWGRRARQNAVDSTREQCERFLRRRPVALTSDQLARCTGRGFVIMRHYGHGLGVGFLESTYEDDESFAQMRSLYPRAFSRDLENTSPFGNPS